MGMKKIEKWIDFSKLPKNKRGQIDWQNSVGYKLPFKYGDIVSSLKILKYNKKESIITIYINGYTETDGKTIKTSHLIYCKLGGVLSKPIVDTHPELVKYFYNRSDADIYTFGSNKKVKMVCQFCGTVKEQSPNQLTNQGFSCSACSDGVSYPNKFIFNMLSQLHISFKNEVNCATPGFEWILNRNRYDFYVEINDKKYFIEADGGWHRYPEVKDRDNQKDILANAHGIDVIRIDCNYHITSMRHNIIKTNILNSELSNIFDLSNIDWQLCEKYSNTNLITTACEYWNKGLTSVSQIASLMNMARNTITSYLKIGANMNLCNYTVEKSKQYGRKNNIKTTKQYNILQEVV